MEDNVEADDLFGEETPEEKAAAQAAKKKAEEAKAKKVKAVPVAKSIIVWEVKNNKNLMTINIFIFYKYS